MSATTFLSCSPPCPAAAVRAGGRGHASVERDPRGCGSETRVGTPPAGAQAKPAAPPAYPAMASSPPLPRSPLPSSAGPWSGTRTRSTRRPRRQSARRQLRQLRQPGKWQQRRQRPNRQHPCCPGHAGCAPGDGDGRRRHGRVRASTSTSARANAGTCHGRRCGSGSPCGQSRHALARASRAASGGGLRQIALRQGGGSARAARHHASHAGAGSPRPRRREADASAKALPASKRPRAAPKPAGRPRLVILAAPPHRHSTRRPGTTRPCATAWSRPRASTPTSIGTGSAPAPSPTPRSASLDLMRPLCAGLARSTTSTAQQLAGSLPSAGQGKSVSPARGWRLADRLRVSRRGATPCQPCGNAPCRAPWRCIARDLRSSARHPRSGHRPAPARCRC